MFNSHKRYTSFLREIVHVLNAVTVLTSELHLNLSTNFAVCHLLGFGTQNKCPFPLNRDFPSTEVTNRKIMNVNIFAGSP